MTKVMSMLASFSKKSTFGVNGQFRVLKIALQDRGDLPIWSNGKFCGVDLFVGWSESDKE